MRRIRNLALANLNKGLFQQAKQLIIRMVKDISQIKADLFHHCLQQVNDRISSMQKAMDAAQEASNQETKSSAGDKFETTRAMMQLEKDKSALQLAAAIKDKLALSQVIIDPIYEAVHPGCLVTTNKGNFFLSISGGKIKLDKEQYYAISAASPIGALLLGKRVGDFVIFNGNRFDVLEVG